MVNKKEDLDLLDEIMLTTILSKAECRIDPLIDRPYYLYQRPNGTSFISLVEPEYCDPVRFGACYLSIVRRQADGKWKVSET